MVEKRVSPRSLCADLMTLEWMDDKGVIVAASAVLEDISARGACLQVEAPVPTDTLVNLRRENDWSLAGKTVYCVFREIGYFIGLEFLEGDDWRKTDFRPQHLLEVTEFLRNS